MFSSTFTVVLLFPLWFSLTQQAPITNQQLCIQGPALLSAQLAQVLQQGYDQLTAAERAQLVYEIRTDSGERAQQLMLEWLKKESNVMVQAAIFNALGATNLATLPEAAVRPFLTAENALVQNAAMRLYGKLPAADFTYLDKLCRESANPGFLIALMEGLCARGDTAFETFPVTTLLQFANGAASPEIEAAALRATLSKPGKLDAEFIHWQATAAASPNVLLRCAAASDAYVNARTPAPDLARDPEPAVRRAVFQAYRDGTLEELQRLLGLPTDADPAIREARLQLLGRLPEIPDIPEVRRILLEGFADSWAQVRTAAEAVLGGENISRELALELTTAALAASADSSRLIAYRQVVARQFSELLEPVRNRLPQETLSENLEAAVQVIVALQPPRLPADLEYLRPYAEHKSPLVRCAVMDAFGRLQTPDSEPIIIRHALKDDNPTVQAHAFEAMGYFPQRVFLPALAECFKNRNGSADAERARSAACWATPRIQPSTAEDLELIDQIAYSIFYLCTQPTIPQGMGMLMFDSNLVISNGLVATARLMKLYPEHEALIENGRKLFELYSTTLEELAKQPPRSQGMNAPVNEINNSVARQARQFLADEAFTQEELQIRDFNPILVVKKADNK